jgi:hypothetical protein
MNEQQKPLTTEQIASGRQEYDERHIDNRDDIDANDRTMDGSSVSKTQTRPAMEAGYSESRMSNDNGNSSPALMPLETANEHREHWTDIQVRFVDDPRDAVEQADELVAEVMQTVASRFAEQRKSLENQWQGGGEASSEDLRQALLQYRSFFERLLAA